MAIMIRLPTAEGAHHETQPCAGRTERRETAPSRRFQHRRQCDVRDHTATQHARVQLMLPCANRIAEEIEHVMQTAPPSATLHKKCVASILSRPPIH